MPDATDSISAPDKAPARAKKNPWAFVNRFLALLAGDESLSTLEVPTLNTHLPYDMVGGSVPYIAGAEIETVWNAASQACGTENVHFCYSVDGGRAWYLAVPSSVLTSTPNCYCPLASALPGQSEHWDKDTVYLYEQEGQASALRWDPDSGRMQLFIGPSRTILPRVQSMNSNFVTINSETAKPLPWSNRNLKQERSTRYTILAALLTGVALTILLLIYIIILNISITAISPKLDDIKKASLAASEKISTNAYQAFATNAGKYLVRARELHQALFELGGQLLIYSVNKEGKMEWQVLLPQNTDITQYPAFRTGKVSPETREDGRIVVIGTE